MAAFWRNRRLGFPAPVGLNAVQRSGRGGVVARDERQSQLPGQLRTGARATAEYPGGERCTFPRNGPNGDSVDLVGVDFATF